jgi:HD-GYP domain-containing protein (c-di-GMP phosphodiesterase class II)
MNRITVKDIPQNSFFTKTVWLDDQFVLAAPEMPFTRELKQALLGWEFKEVQSDGEMRDAYTAEDDGDDEEAHAAGLRDAADFLNGDQIKQAEAFYALFLDYAERVLGRVTDGKKLDFNMTAEKMRQFCDTIKEDRSFLLRAPRNAGPSDQHFLASHAVNSVIISIIIGYALKLPNHRLIELAVAALVHEVGMLKLPPELYLGHRPLTPQEQKTIMTHPVLGYSTLQSFNFPLAVSVAALEHHERENGNGYPRKLAGNQISLYSKIIAVACSYDALTDGRPHHDALDGYTGMPDLLKNTGKLYDDTIVSALASSISDYPIGLYVLLSSGHTGQVLDVNPETPRFPIVRLLEESEPDGKNKVVQTSSRGIHIARPLRREEIGAL